MDEKMSKRGQVAIFVIIAIILIVGIGFIFFLRGGGISSDVADSSNVEQYISRCVRESTKKTLDKITPQGGFAAPTDYKTYEDVKATYICKNVNYYEACINQYPQYLKSVEKEITTEVNKYLGGCFAALEGELKRQNYDVSYSTPTLKIVMKPDFVDAIVSTKMSVSKNGKTQSYNDFTVRVNSPIYLLTSTAQIIASQEAQYCYFEFLGYSLLHPELTVKEFSMSDATRIYTIADTKTNTKMNIAIKGCTIPAGF
jgi:hypothetical protein